MTYPSNILTFSSMQTFQLCQQKYYWQQLKCLRPEVEPDADALNIGKAFHAGMNAVDAAAGLETMRECFVAHERKAILPEQFFKVGELRAKTRAMVAVAWAKWPERPQIRECTFCKEIPGGANGFVLSGRVDGVLAPSVLEYKTVADAKEFIATKRIGHQLPGYLWAVRDQCGNISSIVFRLVEKPTIRRLGITTKRKNVETEEEYEERCRLWLTEYATSHLVEEAVPYTEASISRFEQYLSDVSKLILWCVNSGIWLRNCLACYTWSRACEYMPLCSQLADGTAMGDVRTDGFVESDPHPELAQDKKEEVAA